MCAAILTFAFSYIEALNSLVGCTTILSKIINISGVAIFGGMLNGLKKNNEKNW